MDERAIDKLIAEQVFGRIPCNEWHFLNLGSSGIRGWTNNRQHDSEKHNCYPQGQQPNYSTDIAAAWKVVERLTSTGFSISLVVLTSAAHASFYIPNTRYSVYAASSDTAPMAICLAALKAVGVDVDNAKESSALS